MTILIKFITKVLAIMAGFQLFSFFLGSVTLSLLFLTVINKFTIEVFIIVLAVLLKLILNVSSFLHFKKVNDFSIIKTLFLTALLDLVLVLLPIILSLKHIRYLFDFYEKISDDFICIVIDINCTLSEPFQGTLFKHLLIYMPITLCLTIAFIFNYKRTIK